MCDKLIYCLLVTVSKITNQKCKNWLLNVLSFFNFWLATIKVACIWRTFVYYTSCLIQTLLARPGINELCLNLLNAKRLHRKHVNKMNLRVIITVKTKLAFKFILEGIFKKKKERLFCNYFNIVFGSVVMCWLHLPLLWNN